MCNIEKEKHSHCSSGLTPGCVARNPSFPYKTHHLSQFAAQADTSPSAVKGTQNKTGTYKGPLEKHTANRKAREAGHGNCQMV